MLMSLFYAFILSLLYQTTSIEAKIVGSFNEKNPKELSQLFSARLEIELVGKKQVCSNVQGEQILRNFFQEHPTDSFYISTKGETKTGYYYYVGKMKSENNKTFTVNIYLKKAGESWQINQLQIQ